MVVAGSRQPLHRRQRSSSSVALLSLALIAGCSAAPPPPPVGPPPVVAAPEAAPTQTPNQEAVPPLLRDIDLTPAQVQEVARINEELSRSAESFVGAANELGRSVAGAARQCKGNTPFIEADAGRLVRVGEEMRAPVIDSIQRIHRLLTPAQRKTVSARLVEGDDAAKRERKNSSRAKELAPVLDLSTVQVMSMLVKAAILWTAFAERAEPWRVHFRTASVDFARDDFDARGEPVAAAPLIPLAVEFLRTGMRQVVPILEPKQCAALGQLIDEKIDEQGQLRAERAAARARVLGHDGGDPQTPASGDHR